MPRDWRRHRLEQAVLKKERCVNAYLIRCISGPELIAARKALEHARKTMADYIRDPTRHRLSNPLTVPLSRASSAAPSSVSMPPPLESVHWSRRTFKCAVTWQLSLLLAFANMIYYSKLLLTQLYI
jgi:hypothetical protein